MRKLNDNLIVEIEKKHKLFSEMKECTFSFLTKKKELYLVDFVVEKMSIVENAKITKQNVINNLDQRIMFSSIN